MNIIIFDNANQCHQWQGPKTFPTTFIFRKEFFEESSKAQQYIEKTLSSINSVEEGYTNTNFTTANISKSHEMEGIDFTPSGSYGLTLIDFPNKKIFSMQEYASVGNLSFLEIDTLMRPNYSIYGVDKNEILKNYLYLLENKIFLNEDNGNEKTVNTLKSYLASCQDEALFNSFLKSHEKPAPQVLYQDFELSPESCWTYLESQSYVNEEISEAIVKTLVSKGIKLTEEQVNSWREFYVEQIDYADVVDNLDTTGQFLVAPYIELEKNKIIDSIEKIEKKHKIKAKSGLSTKQKKI